MEFSQSILQLDGMLVVPRDVAGTTSPSTVGVQGLVHSLKDLGIATHSQVVVGAPHGHTLIHGPGMGAREFLGQPVDVVEVAVGFVLVLLLQLGIVEALVIERRTTRGRRVGAGDCGFLLLSGVGPSGRSEVGVSCMMVNLRSLSITWACCSYLARCCGRSPH